MSDPNLVFNETQRQLLGYLENVQHDMPSDRGGLRTIIAMAFMCGAAVIMEMSEKGAGAPFITYADTLERRRAGAALGMRDGLLASRRLE
jgi:hypothetical protein